MKERRKRRSGRTSEALHLLLETVRKRSDISSIAIIDGSGLVVSGTGSEEELLILSAVAAPAAVGAFDAVSESLTEGTDVVSCPLAIGEDKMYLAALGDRVARMPEAARSVTRILRAS